MIKRIVAALVVLGLVTAAYTQNIEGVNARLDGMGGSGLPDDIGWSIGNPRAISSFPDVIQGSAVISEIDGLGSVFGRMVLIKSIGEHFLFGLTANNGSVLWGDYYNIAKTLGVETGSKIVDIPHLSLCAKINDDFSVGIGGFSEVYHRYYTKKDTVNNVTIDTSCTRKMVNWGGTVDAKLTLGPLTLVPIFTFGKPYLSWITEEKGTNPSKTELVVKDSWFFRGGTMAWWDIGNTWWIVGGWYRQENYRFNLNKTVDFSNRTDRFIDWFVGFQPSFSDDLFLGPEYDGGVAIYSIEPTKLNQADSVSELADTTVFYVYHTFRLGIEKSVDKVWIFDELAFRAGMVYRIDKEVRRYKSADGDIYEEEELYEIWENFYNDLKEADGMKLTLGLGVTKGRATFDISAELLEWKSSGILSGPTASMATLTVDISSKK